MYPPLVSPPGPHDEYIPPENVIALLPDPRNENPPGEQYDVENDGPVMRAAILNDIRILKGLVHYGFPPTNYIVGPLSCPWKSSITNALLAGPDFNFHVRFLVECGADPNGFPRFCFRVASTRFVRGRAFQDTWIDGSSLRDRPQAMLDISPAELRMNQAAPLSKVEIGAREKFRGRFWAEPSFPRINKPTNNPPHPLSAAIKTRNKEIYEYMVGHGSDESAWMDVQKYTLLTDDLPVSYFAVQSPMLTSIENEDENMLKFLLDRGHKPDTFPMVLVTRCMNPLMATLAKHRPWLEGFDLLAPYADLSLLTPIFKCHLLHFAVATLNLPAIQHVIGKMGGLKAAKEVPPTGLGHTLFHIASLPIDDSVVNMHSQKIYLSIHEFRTTDEQWAPQHLLSTPPPTVAELRGRGRGRRAQLSGRKIGGTFYSRPRQIKPKFSNLSKEARKEQSEVLLYLLDSFSTPESQLKRQDIHGNTALHYLVSIRNPDYELIQKLRGGNSEDLDIWRNIKNVYGFSANDLDSDNRTAKASCNENDYAPFWCDNEDYIF